MVQSKLVPPTEYMGRAIQTMMLAQSYYATGEFEQAEQLAQETLEGASKVGKVSPIFGFDVVRNTAQDLLRWSKLWQATPLVCGPEKLERRVATGNGKTVWKTRLVVRSFKAVALDVKCDDASVKCTVVPLKDDPWFPRRETRFAEQIIEVEVPLTTALQTELHISSAQLPGASCDIPLQISL